MNGFREQGLPRGAINRIVLCVAAVTATAALGLAIPGAAGAAVLAPWGSSLSATPTLDTANGASSDTNDEPKGLHDRNQDDQGISSGFDNGCMSASYGTDGSFPCTHWMHDGADNTEWNTAVAGGTATAPAGGQILQIKVKGCALKEDTAPSQKSAGLPVNYVVFDTMTPEVDGSFKVHYGPAGTPSNPFLMPFCKDDTSTTNSSIQTTSPAGTVTPNSITTFVPLHLCVAPGEVPAFYDIGGFIASDGKNNGASYYPQGVPFQIMAPVQGSSMDSYADANIAPTSGGQFVYAPGARPVRPNNGGDQNTGWGSEPNQELMLQVIEGVGDDAYGLCPGGLANEPQHSNDVQCVARPANPSDHYPYGTCNANNQPVLPPQNQSAPTISVSGNGAPVSGAPLPGNRIDATSGTWSQDPHQSFITYAYQWEDCDSAGANCTPIGGQVGENPYYYVTNNDVGHTIEVAVSARNNANTEGPASSAPTAAVAGPNVPIITLLKLNPATWNESQSSVITYFDTDTSSTTIQILQNGAVVKTIRNTDRAKQYGGNGIRLGRLPAGNYQLQLTANNRGTLAPVQTLSFTVTPATPVITHLKVNPSSFNASKGATVTYTDSLSGKAVLSVVQCQKRKKGVCTKYKTFKTVRHTDRAGANGVKLTGVAVGHYQLMLVSTYAGHKSLPALSPFRAKLVKSKRHRAKHTVRHTTLELGAGVASIFG